MDLFDQNKKMMGRFIRYVADFLTHLGDALWFFVDVTKYILQGRIRFDEVMRQVYQQGLQSLFIVALTSLASGVVIALQGYIVLVRFGAKEAIAQLVAWSIIREMSPVFTAIIFSAKAGARIAAELGTMNVNSQIMATRTLGVDPIEYLAVPRVVACFMVIPILTIISMIIGVAGGYVVGVFEANVPGAYYISQTLKAIRFIDFFSGYVKVFFFAIIIGWTCCYHGFATSGGSLGVGRYTTNAVAMSIILILVSNTLLTKIIITFWR